MNAAADRRLMFGVEEEMETGTDGVSGENSETDMGTDGVLGGLKKTVRGHLTQQMIHH